MTKCIVILTKFQNLVNVSDYLSWKNALLRLYLIKQNFINITLLLGCHLRSQGNFTVTCRTEFKIVL